MENQGQTPPNRENSIPPNCSTVTPPLWTFKFPFRNERFGCHILIIKRGPRRASSAYHGAVELGPLFPAGPSVGKAVFPRARMGKSAQFSANARQSARELRFIASGGLLWKIARHILAGWKKGVARGGRLWIFAGVSLLASASGESHASPWEWMDSSMVWIF